jgi:hypothetical membrane protein
MTAAVRSSQGEASDPSAASPAWGRLLGPAAAGAAGVHVVSVLAAGALTPSSYPLSHAISDLGMVGKPYAELTNVGGMIVPGVLVALSAVLAAKALPTPRAVQLGLAIMALAGTSLVVAGLFPFPLRVHLAAALAAACFCAIGLALLSGWTATYLGHRVWATTGYACALLLAVDAVFWVLAEGLRTRPHGLLGLEQRVAAAAGFWWWGIAAIALARRAR